MQRLGEILIAKGVLSLAELHTALETCHRTGGRLGTQLLEFGYVDESMLLGALSKQLGVPSVSRVKLLHSPLEVRKLLPTDIGRRLQAVPFQTVGDQVKVAMTNPNDRAAADEIAGA
ncbi:MAG: general secretion pathway protein GspE, partial [Holophagae bacterium]